MVVWLYRSLKPQGRKGLFYLFIWRLPAFAALRGGEGRVSTLWLTINIPQALAQEVGSRKNSHKPVCEYRFYPGGHKEMSSISADQEPPRIWAQMQGGGGLRGLSQWVQLCTWSPNKLWSSNSILNLWFHFFRLLILISSSTPATNGTSCLQKSNILF
jgi:hypothetical protein